MSALPRREQPAITIRSAKAVERLKLLTRDGRSQAEVIEEALQRLPVPRDLDEEGKKLFLEIKEIISKGSRGNFPTMKEVDAEQFDEEGNCR
ncbi:MAG: hypothetical protein AAGD40_06375 [Pseudomonadota bacterium]